MNDAAPCKAMPGGTHSAAETLPDVANDYDFRCPHCREQRGEWRNNRDPAAAYTAFDYTQHDDTIARLEARIRDLRADVRKRLVRPTAADVAKFRKDAEANRIATSSAMRWLTAASDPLACVDPTAGPGPHLWEGDQA